MRETEDSSFRVENVVNSAILMRAGQCVVQVLPELGGKIASIRVGEHELLQTPLAPLRPRTTTMGFDESDASGWDECLPSVAACTVKAKDGTVDIPDHGDLWRVPWKQVPEAKTENARTHASVTLHGKCFSLPLELERKLELHEQSRGWRLRLDYKLTNAGSHAVPWSWAAHPLFVAAEGDRIRLPNTVTSLRVEGSGGLRLGRSGDNVSWPLAKLADGNTVDLSRAQSPNSGVGDKLFAGPLAPDENWCALERPSAELRVKVKFNPAATPYFGLWICYGGWPEKPGPKQVCVAMEPATAPVDSLAVTGTWSRTLAPQESFSWPMEIEIEPLER